MSGRSARVTRRGGTLRWCAVVRGTQRMRTTGSTVTARCLCVPELRGGVGGGVSGHSHAQSSSMSFTGGVYEN